MRSLAGTPTASVTRSASSRSTGARRADADLDVAPADADDLARPLGAVAAVEEGDRVARLQAQHLDVARRCRRQGDDAAGGERLGNEETRRHGQSFRPRGRGRAGALRVPAPDGGGQPP